MAQEVFERIEKKYLLPETVFRRLLPELRKHMADDVYGRYTISNIYFDTEQFDLIRASLEKPVYKEKLRLRCYGTPSEDGKVFVEIKKKYKGIVYKRRITLSLKEARRYLVYGIRPDMTDWKFTRQQIFREIDYMKERYGLRPAAFIAYDRIALAGTDLRGRRIRSCGSPSTPISAAGITVWTLQREKTDSSCCRRARS